MIPNRIDVCRFLRTSALMVLGLILLSACPPPSTMGSLSLSLGNGNFDSPQNLQITYNAVGGESPDSILYTSTTDGTEPADPSISANSPSTYTLGTDIAILATAESQFRIRAIARRGSSTIAEVSGRYTRGDADGDEVFASADVDDDNDGLIEITGATMAEQLTMLHNMRFNLAGTSYDSTDDGTTAMTGEGGAMEANPGSTSGAPIAATSNCSSGTDFDNDPTTPPTFLCGYELTGNLTFDTDGEDDGTWTESAGVYTLDSGDSASPYFVVEADGTGGWIAIGDCGQDGYCIDGKDNVFDAVFDGNGHTIHWLALHRSDERSGMFGAVGRKAVVRNIGLENILILNSADRADRIPHIGGLIGEQIGRVLNSHTTGSVIGSDDRNSVGGLVGYLYLGEISESYSEAIVSGEGGGQDRVGGLVGFVEGGTISTSYATGMVLDNGGNGDSVGGLVGYLKNEVNEGKNIAGQIKLSHASAMVNDSAGIENNLGGLVGRQIFSTIIASYATGAVSASNDSYTKDNLNENIGGLVGYSDKSSIIASNARGLTNGGGGNNDSVGGLVGTLETGNIFASFASSTVRGGVGNGISLGGLVGFSRDSIIQTSYFSGDVTAGDGDAYYTGGLVGWQSTELKFNLIGTTYSTGSVLGGGDNTGNANTDDFTGLLVGYQGYGGSLNTITASYGLATISMEGRTGQAGTPISNSAWTGIMPATNRTSARLTLAIANDPDGISGTANDNKWDLESANSKDAWDFGNDSQTPVLKFADYDGNSKGNSSGNLFHCEGRANPPADAIIIPDCGTIIPGQR